MYARSVSDLETRTTSIELPPAADEAVQTALRRATSLIAVGGTAAGAVILPLTGTPFPGVELNGMLFWVVVCLAFSVLMAKRFRSPQVSDYTALAVLCAGANAITHSTGQRDGSEVILTLFVCLLWGALVLPTHLMFLASSYVAVAPVLFGGNVVASTFFVNGPGDINGTLLGTIAVFGFGMQQVIRQALLGLKHFHHQRSVEFDNIRHQLERSLEARSRELVLSREQVMRAEKIRTVGTLAAGLAHELNNILTPARGFAEILALGETSPTQTVDYGRRILDATIASNSITKALLTYTKQSIYSPEPINLLNLLNLQIRPVLAQVIPDEVTLTVTCPRRLTLIVDAQLLQQSITNLVLNAVDALPQGGTITIAARQVPADGTRPPHAEIIVRDTGQGIPQEQVSQIFDPFFTTKKHGTGLGLPAVLGAMERHDGTIDVTSQVGRGTTFSLRLPVAAAMHRGDNDRDVDSDADADAFRTAALLTSDEDLFDEVEEMMADVDIRLLHGPALSTVEGGHEFPVNFSFVTLVLFDLDGWTGSFESAVDAVRAHFPLPTLLALSSSPTSVAAVRRGDGRVSCLRKPIVQSQLNSRLAAFGTPVSP